MMQSLSWLDAVCVLPPGHMPAVLVSVATTQGSTPRAAGAKMLVTREALVDTIGGGHLEFYAITQARAMLEAGTPLPPRMERCALGPSLGQCCGGAVQLVWEVIDARAQAVFIQMRNRRRARADSWRLLAMPLPTESTESTEPAESAGQEDDTANAAPTSTVAPGWQTTIYLQDGVGRTLHEQGETGLQAPQYVHTVPSQLLRSDGCLWLVEALYPLQAHLYLFGAGHVGRALVRALAPLPCHVTWIDEREEMFPTQVPENVRMEACADPRSLLALAKPGSSFLVMTHSHQLDMDLAEAILHLPHLAQFGWFGLIGSHSKSELFRKRLLRRDLTEQQVAQMVCPIGLPGIDSKLPEVIAASVAAQLLQVWQRQGVLPH